MDKYKILPHVTVELEMVTVGAVRVAEELGLMNNEDEAINEVKELYLVPDQLKRWIYSMFKLTDEQKQAIEDDLSTSNGDHIILEEVVRGHRNFHKKLQPSPEEFQELLKNFLTLKSETNSSSGE